MSWLASHWLNLVGIQTVNHIGIIERFNALGLKDSYLITEQNLGIRMDKINFDKRSATLIANRFAAFYKRLAWIDFSHGDAKSSNFIFKVNNIMILGLGKLGRLIAKSLQIDYNIKIIFSVPFTSIL